MSEHNRDDHAISGSPHEQMRGILARHLCGWITGHAGPVNHFIADADMILEDAHQHGLRIHVADLTSNSADGFLSVLATSSSHHSRW